LLARAADDAVWQGARLRRGRSADIQGRPLRRPDRRRKPVAAGETPSRGRASTRH
jgi:hypothetical protein